MNTHQHQNDDGFRVRPARTLESLRRQQADKIAAITATIGLPPASVNGFNPKSSTVYKHHRRSRLSAAQPRVQVQASAVKLDPRCKPVLCVETDVLYPSAAEAAKAIGARYQGIYQAMVRGGTCGGKHWRRPTRSDFVRIAAKAAS